MTTMLALALRCRPPRALPARAGRTVRVVVVASVLVALLSGCHLRWDRGTASPRPLPGELAAPGRGPTAPVDGTLSASTGLTLPALSTFSGTEYAGFSFGMSLADVRARVEDAGLSARSVGPRTLLVANARTQTRIHREISDASAPWVAEVPDLEVRVHFDAVIGTPGARVIAVELRGTPRGAPDAPVSSWQRFNPWVRFVGPSYAVRFPGTGLAVRVELGQGRSMGFGQAPLLLLTDDTDAALSALASARAVSVGARADVGASLAVLPLEPSSVVARFVGPRGFWPPPSATNRDLRFARALAVVARLFPPPLSTTGDTADRPGQTAFSDGLLAAAWNIYLTGHGGAAGLVERRRRWEDAVFVAYGLSTGTSDPTNAPGPAVANPRAAQTADAFPPTVRLLAPTSGATFFAGEPIEIRWECADNRPLPPAPITLEISDGTRAPGGGLVWRAIVGATQAAVRITPPGKRPRLANQGRLSWSPPAPLATSESYRIRLSARDAAGNVTTVVSAAPFSVVPRGPATLAAASVRLVRAPAATNRASLSLRYAAERQGSPVSLKTLTVFARRRGSGADPANAWVALPADIPATGAFPAQGVVAVALPLTFADRAAPTQADFELDLAGTTTDGRATYAAGERRVRATVRFDTRPPSLRLTAPDGHQAPALVTLGEPVFIRWACADRDLGDTPVAIAIAAASGDAFTSLTPAAGIANSGRFRWVPALEHLGDRRLRIVVTDRAGNETSASVALRVTRRVPEVAFVDPPVALVKRRTPLRYAVTLRGAPYPRPLASVTLWWRYVAPDGTVSAWQSRAFTPDATLELVLDDDAPQRGAIDCRLTVVDQDGVAIPAPTASSPPELTLPLALADR